MADAPRGPETRVAYDHRAHQLIRVEATLHQHFGLAFTHKTDGHIRGSLAMRRVDELISRKVYAGFFRDSLDLFARSDQDRHENAESGSLDCSPEGGFVAWMRDCG